MKKWRDRIDPVFNDDGELIGEGLSNVKGLFDDVPICDFKCGECPLKNCPNRIGLDGKLTEVGE